MRLAEELGAIAPGEEGRDSHAASQLCPPSADERDTDQLPVTLAGALFDSDDTDIPGACAGPDGQSGDGAMNMGFAGSSYAGNRSYGY